MLRINVAIVVDESYGFVKAVRVLVNGCGIKTDDMAVDSFRNTIQIQVTDIEKLRCVTSVKGSITAEVKYTITCDRNLKKLLKDLSFSILPLESQRIVGYKAVGNAMVIVKRTSNPSVYFLTPCFIRNFTIPLPSTACTYMINKADDIERLKEVIEVVLDIGKKILNLCRESPTSS
jgi:hypothetical protein